MKTSLLSHSDETKTKTVKILYFDNVDVITKKGKHIKRLKAHHKDVNIPFVPDFITSLLPKIIHHINLLKNYHTNMKTILENIDNCIVVGLDFSENLNCASKTGASVFALWSKDQKTVHSGILKLNGEKQYHPYFSDDLQHDQSFVATVIENMLDGIDVVGKTLVIISDNCCAQYKSVQNFTDHQNLANKLQVTIVRIYGIPGHGKNEIDCVGGGGEGVVKIAIRRAVTEGHFFPSATSCYAECDMMDDYKNIIPTNQMYSGHYLEKESKSPKGGNSYRIYDKKVIHTLNIMFSSSYPQFPNL